jgi:hypothetical protein
MCYFIGEWRDRKAFIYALYTLLVSQPSYRSTARSSPDTNTAVLTRVIFIATHAV